MQAHGLLTSQSKPTKFQQMPLPSRWATAISSPSDLNVSFGEGMYLPSLFPEPLSMVPKGMALCLLFLRFQTLSKTASISHLEPLTTWNTTHMKWDVFNSKIHRFWRHSTKYKKNLNYLVNLYIDENIFYIDHTMCYVLRSLQKLPHSVLFTALWGK